jgi:Holliday junction resolvase RusA-like endonuclease
MTAVVVIPGKPMALARARVSRGRHYLPDAHRAYRETIQWHARAAGCRTTLAPVAMTVEAVFPLPGSASKRKREEMAGTPHALASGDLDNVVKAIGDALNGVAYADDAQVCELRARKRWCNEGESPHVRVEIEEVTT